MSHFGIKAQARERRLPETLSNLTGKRIRRCRRRTRTTKVEKILVLRKRADSIHTVDEEPVAVYDRQPRKPRPACRRRS